MKMYLEIEPSASRKLIVNKHGDDGGFVAVVTSDGSVDCVVVLWIMIVHWNSIFMWSAVINLEKRWAFLIH